MAVDTSKIAVELETLDMLQEETAAKITRGNSRNIAKSGEMMKKWYSLIDKVYAKNPLAIPSERDSVLQQALLNILQPIFDPEFHPSSYGYRPNRSCQQAVAKAERFMNKYELEHVVDKDLSKCYARLNHDPVA